MRAGLVAALITVVAIQGVNSNYGLADTGFDSLYSSINGMFGNRGNYYANYRSSSSSSSSSSSESYEYKKCEKCNRLKKFNFGNYEAGLLSKDIYIPSQTPKFTYFHHKGCKKAIITCPTNQFSLIVAKVKDHKIPGPKGLFPDDIAPLAFGIRASTVVKCDGKNKKWKAQELFTDEWVKFTEVSCLPIVSLFFSGPAGDVKISANNGVTSWSLLPEKEK